ncbi:nuclear transport factor 2 family protein [Micromonospora sp. WMMD1128]|uniref:nuclear transport factor 2 family protein n=1 Tax=Micromonospora sp. WMMD1128 TaxID=3015150 RepID=UPI00248B317F|nr:nuclear transport factor 2 family protein [Micromonospora sp. WMMD1128]WBB76114.1 nuclear transport factor 2 family protein [Micromonospora sp. WMMD1128]
MTPRTDLAGYLIRYPQEAGLGDEDPATVLDRYHTPDYELVNDGVLLDRKRLLDHIRPARKRAVGLRVEVEQALVDGDHVAARYRLIAELRKGATITTEIYMFGELAADGRLRRAVQATRTIPSA